jgi:hypothetical protein
MELSDSVSLCKSWETLGINGIDSAHIKALRNLLKDPQSPSRQSRWPSANVTLPKVRPSAYYATEPLWFLTPYIHSTKVTPHLPPKKRRYLYQKSIVWQRQGSRQDGKSVSVSSIPVIFVRFTCHRPAMRFVRMKWLNGPRDAFNYLFG